MYFNVTQITKINQQDFVFSDKSSLTFPIPPLASAQLYRNQGVLTLKICATVYINSKDSQSPAVRTLIENDTNIEIYFDYDWDESTPDTYDVWYVEVDYISDTINNIKTVTSYLRNLDPETSRGTETGVQN
ncbi:hypothetical protein [Flavobacterium collinsii]|jgi:hypothetical protein|uniref:Uncharacterized protein n=1 Tax=Flavobacterium collinsii TaxID=1114861 RepID=A0A9W4TGP9_9FLAO|nr:hypothetical protein [Flavobacterium collinsii]CAA9199274.1 hypothetical protein FLACOL7796_02641 [Flavobacterium collinsii]CAI2766421.1 conserved protein of unknown function [Flavobacterium collinsii]